MVCSISNIAFSIFGLPVHWYSLAYIFGIIISLRVSIFLSNSSGAKIPLNLFDDFVNAIILGVIFGGRIGYVLFYDFDYYARNPIEVFKIWKGGMSFYGGFIGIAIVSRYFCRNHGIPFFQFMDLWSVSVPVGLFFGRIANFINGELLGRESLVPWNVVFRDGIHRHPSQLYEAFLEGVVLFLIMLAAFKKKLYKYRGRLSGIFCSGYGLARFCGEFFREPDSMFSYKLLCSSGLNLNQYMSMCMVILGIFLITKSNRL